MASPVSINAENHDIIKLSKDLSEAMTTQRYAQIAESGRLSAELTKKLTLRQMEVAGFQAERAIVNARAQRLMSSLAGKFSLIAKIQQNLG